jgi:DNA recombination-mediator protein A
VLAVISVVRCICVRLRFLVASTWVWPFFSLVSSRCFFQPDGFGPRFQVGHRARLLAEKPRARPSGTVLVAPAGEVPGTPCSTRWAHHSALRHVWCGARPSEKFRGREIPGTPCSTRSRASIVASSPAKVAGPQAATSRQVELFPQRSRIISGLCLVVVVVEAAPRSGSLSTRNRAMETTRCTTTRTWSRAGPVEIPGDISAGDGPKSRRK